MSNDHFRSFFDINKFNLKADATSKRRELVKLARVAEAGERYEDMCIFMRALVLSTESKELDVDERNLLSVAYKNVIGARRAAWRTLNVDEHKEDSLVQTYKKKVIEEELEAICQDILGLLEGSLVPHANSQDESKVFYLKMTGDYYRYLAEFVEGKSYDQKASTNYDAAMEIAVAKLSPTHPIRLGLALNFSVCCYEILKDHKKACELAKKAFDEAISKLDQLDEASYKDSTLIMQLLRDNLTLWTSEDSAGNEDHGADGGEDD